MKICMVTPIETSLKLLFSNELIYFVRAGNEVHCASNLEYESNLDFFSRNNIKFHKVHFTRSISLFSDLVTILQLYRLFRREKFDVVHNQLPKGVLLGAIAGRLAGVPLIVNTSRPLFSREAPKTLKKRVFILVEKIANMFAHYVLVENPADYELYLRERIVGKEKLDIQGNGIDLTRFDPSLFPPEKVRAIKRKLNIPETAMVVGTVGRYVYEKGYKEFFESAKIILKEYPFVYFLCAGMFLPSEREPIPRDLPIQMGIQNRIIMLENRDDMPEIYAMMDIMVLATHRDCFPKSLIEASSMAKPIIATDIIGCKTVVEHKKTGILVPPRNSEELAKAIKQLVENEGLRKTLGENARKYAVENFDAKKICEKLLNLYEELLKQRKA